MTSIESSGAPFGGPAAAAAAPRGRLRRALPRAGWSLTDQLISSATNFLLSVLVARSVSLRAFGAYGVCWAIYVIALGVVRAVGGEPLLVRHGQKRVAEADKHVVSSGAGMSVVVGLVLSVSIAALALVLPPLMGTAMFALAIALPGLVVQDYYRYVFFACQEPRAAVISDGAWAVFQTVGFAALIVLHVHSVFWFVLVWGIAAAAAAVVAFVQVRALPALSGLGSWIRHNGDLSWRFLGEFATQIGTTQLNTFGLGVVASLSDIGAVRAASVILPSSILNGAGIVLATPEASRTYRRTKSARAVVRVAMMLASTLAVAAIAGGIAVRLLPQSIGRALLRASWREGRSLAPIYSLFLACQACTIGAQMGLRVLNASGRSLKLRVQVSPLYLGAGLLGGYLDGAHGFAGGLAVATFVAAVLWWRTLIGVAKELDLKTETVEADAKQDAGSTAAETLPSETFQTES